MSKTTYKAAGVDIKQGEKAVKKIKDLVRSTFTPGVMKEIGGFGGMFEPDLSHYKYPVLVASTDGVGTKLKVAVMAGKHDSVGEDLVNHCVNDIAVGGATPLFFLDYFASGQLDQNVFVEVIKGFVRGCRNNGCALIGGETAEMPDMYSRGEYDLSGTVVGIVDRQKIIDGQKIKQGSTIVGINSNGLHTNGYSLARKILFERYSIDSYVPELGCTIAEALLTNHISYLHLIQSLTKQYDIQGIAHITGGGIEGNSSRLLTDMQQLHIDWESWKRPVIFHILKELGNVPEADMRATFNLGIGLTLFIDPQDTDGVCQSISDHNFTALPIGHVI
jgi:phosphoribosylformylglycinamidine cyclo-ligase